MGAIMTWSCADQRQRDKEKFLLDTLPKGFASEFCLNSTFPLRLAKPLGDFAKAFFAYASVAPRSKSFPSMQGRVDPSCERRISISPTKKNYK